MLTTLWLGKKNGKNILQNSCRSSEAFKASFKIGRRSLMAKASLNRRIFQFLCLAMFLLMWHSFLITYTTFNNGQIPQHIALTLCGRGYHTGFQTIKSRVLAETWDRGNAFELTDSQQQPNKPQATTPGP